MTHDGKRLMLVAAKSRVKLLAGSIGKTIRENDNDPPVLSAVGAASVNQAIKAIAIARDFISNDGLDLYVQVSRKPQQEVKDIMIFELTTHPKGQKFGEDNKENDDFQDMRSASKSTLGKLAGAIAANIRNQKIPRITGIGQIPVFKAVRAVALARRYVEKDGLDLVLKPSFTQVKFENGTDANAIEIIVLPKKMG